MDVFCECGVDVEFDVVCVVWVCVVDCVLEVECVCDW